MRSNAEAMLEQTPSKLQLQPEPQLTPEKTTSLTDRSVGLQGSKPSDYFLPLPAWATPREAALIAEANTIIAYLWERAWGK